MKRYLIFSGLCMMSFFFFAHAEPQIIDTQKFFPLDRGKFEFRLKSRKDLWRIYYNGLTQIGNRQVYQIDTYFSNNGQAERLSNRSFYGIDEKGDIYLQGSLITSWLIKWLERPELILKRQMKMGKSYIVSDRPVDNVPTLVTITLKKVMNVKLKNTAKHGILVERLVRTEQKAFNNNLNKFNYRFEQRYYVEGLGLIKYSGSCNCGGCSSSAPARKEKEIFCEE